LIPSGSGWRHCCCRQTNRRPKRRRSPFTPSSLRTIEHIPRASIPRPTLSSIYQHTTALPPPSHVNSLMAERFVTTRHESRLHGGVPSGLCNLSICFTISINRKSIKCPRRVQIPTHYPSALSMHCPKPNFKTRCLNLANQVTPPTTQHNRWRRLGGLIKGSSAMLIYWMNSMKIGALWSTTVD
jgi:hypothetical protein